MALSIAKQAVSSTPFPTIGSSGRYWSNVPICMCVRDGIGAMSGNRNWMTIINAKRPYTLLSSGAVEQNTSQPHGLNVINCVSEGAVKRRFFFVFSMASSRRSKN